MTTASWTRQNSNGALTAVGLHAVGSLFDLKASPPADVKGRQTVRSTRNGKIEGVFQVFSSPALLSERGGQKVRNFKSVFFLLSQQIKNLLRSC